MTTATSEMEPSRILFACLQPFPLADRGVTGGILLECCGSPRSATEFYNLSDNVIVILYYILTSSSLSGRYQSVYIYIQICTDGYHLLGGGRAEICYAYYNFFFFFSRLNGSAERSKG